MKKLATAICSALVGCATQVSAPPHACDLISDIPGLRTEIWTLRNVDESRISMGLDPTSSRLRAYAKHASRECAYNRELGAHRATPAPPEPPWYVRFWNWVRGA